MSSPLVWAAGALLLGALAGYWLALGRARTRQTARSLRARGEAEGILSKAKEEADNLRRAGELAGREEGFRLRKEWEQEEKRRRREVERLERRQEARAFALGERVERADQRSERLRKLETELDGRLRRAVSREDQIERRSSELASLSAQAETRQAQLEHKVLEHHERSRLLEERESDLRERLEAVAKMSAEEAKAALIAGMEAEARTDAARTVREILDRARADGEVEARKIIVQAIQRMAAECTTESTVSVVELPSDEMKGRIIGREGRNIRAFEKETGVNVIIDDTPGAVVLSCFEPRRREVARIALDRLVDDGRIHPARIEDTIQKARQEVDGVMRRAAAEALGDLGITDVPREIVKRLGMLHFRTSYGQNQLKHSREVAWLAATMATELGLDTDLAKRAGLLHDIGKGFSHDREGTHVELGYRLCRRHGEHPVVLNAIRAHHDEEEHLFPEAFLVTAADAISGSRPGARRETAEDYIRRIEKLEEIAMDHAGVERCFALHAGREIRVMVQPQRVTDSEMSPLSKTIASRLEDELRYPGKIKVVIVRETRAEEYAR